METIIVLSVIVGAPAAILSLIINAIASRFINRQLEIKSRPSAALCITYDASLWTAFCSSCTMLFGLAAVILYGFIA